MYKSTVVYQPFYRLLPRHFLVKSPRIGEGITYFPLEPSQAHDGYLIELFATPVVLKYLVSGLFLDRYALADTFSTRPRCDLVFLAWG